MDTERREYLAQLADRYQYQGDRLVDLAEEAGVSRQALSAYFKRHGFKVRKRGRPKRRRRLPKNPSPPPLPSSPETLNTPEKKEEEKETVQEEKPKRRIVNL